MGAETVHKKLKIKNKVNPRKADCWRFMPRKGKIIIEFGRVNKNKETEIEVISSVYVEPIFLRGIIASHLKSGIFYQQKYDEDIGFNLEPIEEPGENNE